MGSDWVCVYTCVSRDKAEITLATLQGQELDAILLSKQDTMYLFGHQEIWVHQDNAESALALIRTFEEE